MPLAVEYSVVERAFSSQRGGTVFKALGIPVMIAGLVFIAFGCWLAWLQWVKLSRWPQTDAVLISKEISEVGARLVLRYEVNGQRFTSIGFRFGSEQTVRNRMASIKPGTTQKISYDPTDPSVVEPILGSAWESFMGPLSSCVFGALFIAGGVIVYRWSNSRFA
jgi:Protein of unknown function (DUF3592)